MKEKNIYNLELHEQLRLQKESALSCWCRVTRVPGGWIYEMFGIDEVSITFVPYSDEFYNKFNPYG